MSIDLYMDEHVPRVITQALRLKQVNVLTAQEDGRTGISDPELLDRATKLGRILFTFDDDLLAEAAERQRAGADFSGVIYAHPLRVSIGGVVRDLEIISKVLGPDEVRNQVIFLPL